jgi:acetaldehyde dehydrogenase (acetylating)
MAGFAIPPDTSIMVAEVEGVGKQHPLSVEKLSPVLALYFVRDFPAAMDTCEAVLRFGGYGHTCVIFSKDEARIREFGLRMPAMRVLVNTAAPQGSTGVTTNLPPSMTLGCGAMAGNVTGDNIGPKHLINIKRIAYGVRRAEEALQVPPLGEAAPASAGAVVERAAIAAAVEKYLAERGVSVAAAPVRPAPAGGAAAEVVDRFLATRRAPEPPECSTCVLEPAAAPAASAQPIEPPKPQITIADFVCEADVRAALEKGRKIYIGPKTIVTPAARELAERQDVLVVAERK